MAYETGYFGKSDGSNVTSDVHNHFGQRKVGGEEGIIKLKVHTMNTQLTSMETALLVSSSPY